MSSYSEFNFLPLLIPRENSSLVRTKLFRFTNLFLSLSYFDHFPEPDRHQYSVACQKYLIYTLHEKAKIDSDLRIHLNGLRIMYTLLLRDNNNPVDACTLYTHFSAITDRSDFSSLHCVAKRSIDRILCADCCRRRVILT